MFTVPTVHCRGVGRYEDLLVSNVFYHENFYTDLYIFVLFLFLQERQILITNYYSGWGWATLSIGTWKGPAQLSCCLILQYLVLEQTVKNVGGASTCIVGGFNFILFFGISIGITRRMIDIGKKITFYFLQNVWKCTVFSHLHLKDAKSTIMTQKIFLEKYHYGYQKNAEFYADFKFVDPGFQKCS